MGKDSAPTPNAPLPPAVQGEITSTIMELMYAMAPQKFCLLIYLWWHTHGQGKPADWLERDDFENGKSVRGERMDKGCGLYAERLDLVLGLLIEDGFVRERSLPIFGVRVYSLDWENIHR